MIHLTNMSYSVLITKESQLQFAFAFKGTQYTFTWLPILTAWLLPTIFASKT